MNKRLDQVLTKIRALSEEEQDVAADILLEYVEAKKAGTWLSREQVEEIERCLSDAEPFASDEEVKAVFGRLTKAG